MTINITTRNIIMGIIIDMTINISSITISGMLIMQC